MYPALDMIDYLSHKLSLASSPPMAIRRVKKSETPDRGLFDFDDSWTAPFQPENLDDLDDIFMMSSHESSAESRAEDEESLYLDAQSRKASIVRVFLGILQSE